MECKISNFDAPRARRSEPGRLTAESETEQARPRTWGIWAREGEAKSSEPGREKGGNGQKG